MNATTIQSAALPPLRLPPGMRWRAHDRFGVGHLLARGSIRYLCDRMPVDERFAWPVLQRCSECVDRLEGRVSESELRAMHGDR